MKKQLLAGILSSTMLLSSMVLVPAQAAIPQAYWQYQAPFENARDSGNHSELVPVALNIVALMEAQQDDSDKFNILYSAYEALAVSYQALKDYDNAIVFLKKQVDLAKVLGFDDAVILGEKRIEQLNPLTEVYLLSDNLSSIPYFGAKYEPKSGAYFGRARDEASAAVMSHESATSFYVEFMDEEISQFNYLIQPQDVGSRMLQICWNMPREYFSLLSVLEDNSTSYIIRNLEYLAGLNSPVLLRIGGEMNVWNDKTDPETFKNAYIKIANLARQYAPNVALVFSPNSISSWGEEMDDYYPGDQYVDWVGVSAYTHKYHDASDPYGAEDFTNMFYNTGDYAECIHGLQEIVAVFGDRKPILVSESGSGWSHKQYSLDLEEFSKTQLNHLYTYANMVFPQVKMIINFDVDYEADEYRYSMSRNTGLMNVYQDSTQNNPILRTSINDSSAQAYVKAGDYQDTRTTLTFASHSAPLGQPNLTVSYHLDGQEKGAFYSIPYSFQLNTAEIGEGNHSFTVKFNGDDGFFQEKHYSLNKNGSTVTLTESVTEVSPGESGNVETTPESGNGLYSDVPTWAETFVQFVDENGILTGENGLFRAGDPAVRGETATALSKLGKGEIQEDFSGNFTDVSGTGYENGVSWCFSTGVMIGSGSYFGTFDNLTREAFATTLRSFAEYKEVYTPASDGAAAQVAGFNDSNSISGWAADSVFWAVENGFLKGYDNNELRPGGNVTRAEMSAILYSYVEKFGI